MELPSDQGSHAYKSWHAKSANEMNGPEPFARQPTAFMADLAKQVDKINQPIDETAGCCFFPFCILDTKAARKCRMIYFSFW
ncbi:hypothetical protein Ciccas_007980 [Cichlidogyrus casuarinus]|uniref:Uncharacterized protein n=1 Tax=Cichlidogyrus casuarinus TaxID=1844966 RepID=A0ABD2Q1A6_9PLAT